MSTWITYRGLTDPKTKLECVKTESVVLSQQPPMWVMLEDPEDGRKYRACLPVIGLTQSIFGKTILCEDTSVVEFDSLDTAKAAMQADYRAPARPATGVLPDCPPAFSEFPEASQEVLIRFAAGPGAYLR